MNMGSGGDDGFGLGNGGEGDGDGLGNTWGALFAGDGVPAAIINNLVRMAC